jgi:dephospho-CoA kinase
MKPLLIGLSGKAGAGKSTVGDYLAGAHGYAQFAFARALKEVVQKIFLFTDEQMTFGKEIGDPRWKVSPRLCMQWLGTDILRDVWPDIWIRHLRQEIMDFLYINGQRPIVVTDVRFRDEAEALKRMGAMLVRLRRDKVHRRVMGHVSETALDGWEGWDYVVENDGSLQDLAQRIETILASDVDKAELAKAAG